MEKIASFRVDHTRLEPGLYISRIDGDVTTFDIRMKKPNSEPVLSTGEIHAIEHIGATLLRNGPQKEKILYFGPMGCRTGFYLLTRSLREEEAIGLVQAVFRDIARFDGPIPGASPVECGNYKDMDLAGAKRESAAYLLRISGCSADRLQY